MSNAHEAVANEMLVRCLDAWAPAALHGASRATYLHGIGMSRAAAAAAASVFSEFEDLLADQDLRIIQIGGGAFPAAVPAGATCGERASLPDPADVKVPIFAALSGAVSTADLRWLGADKRADVLWIAAPQGARAQATAAGFDHLLDVDLVDRGDEASKLVFATHSGKTLERAKGALWAIDEFAGVRFRDPADPSGTPVDIALTPQLKPLVSALSAELGRRSRLTVAEIKDYTAGHTAYRGVDAARAATAMIQQGLATREPVAGRLTPQTTLHTTAVPISPSGLPKAG